MVKNPVIKNYVLGAWAESNGHESVEVINPATQEVIGHCPLGNAQDVAQAVAAAKSAFPGWRSTPSVDRAQPLFRMKALLETHQDELARLITREHGKTLVESRGEMRRAIQMVETACGISSLMMGDVIEDIASGVDCQTIRRPMGVFAGITPFNFPAMVPFWFWPFAVATGNTFVLKPSERVPLTSMRVFELIEQAGFPKGVMNLVHGGKAVVDALLAHPDVKGISFVGSTPVAKYIYQTGCSSGKRVQALGGAKNFMVILPDAVIEKATRTALESIIGCAGERCLAGSVVISVGDPTYKEVCDRIAAQARDTIVGDGADERTQMGPLISQASKERVLGLIQSALDEGAKLLVDGRKGVEKLPGFYLRPTVLADIRPEMRIAKEEVFGPVVLISKVAKFDDAISWINSSPYGNTTTLFTTSGGAARKFMYEVDPSMIGINIGVPAPMSFFSFGGSKDSFFGDIKVHGRACVDFYTDLKITTTRWLSESSIW